MDATTEVLQSEEVTYAKSSPSTQQDENKVNSNDRVNSQDDTEGSQENAGNNASNNKTLQEAQELVEKCKEVYHVHKLDQAIKYLKQFEELKDSLNNEDLEAYMKIVADEQILFDQIHDEYDYLTRIDKELESHESWKEDQVSQNLKVFYKTAENGLLIAKIEAIVDVGLLPIISMINEVELWKLWNAFMNHTVEVKTLHRAAKVYYVEYGLPYPLSNREIHLYGVGVNRLHDNGTVMILAKSIDNDDAFFEKHDFKKVVHNGTINIDVNLGAFEIKPLGREKCILRGVANLNPKFDWVPQKILNWVIRKGTKQMVEKIIAGAKTFKGSPWEKEIHKEHKKDFYDWLQVQLEEYYVVHETKPAEEENK